MFSTHFWDKLSPEEHDLFSKAVHLLPTREMVRTYNLHRLAILNKPVVQCHAKHRPLAAKKASEEDAEGLEIEILLAEEAIVMITHNL